MELFGILDLGIWCFYCVAIKVIGSRELMAISHTLSQPIFTTNYFKQWRNKSLGKYIFMLRSYSQRQGQEKKKQNQIFLLITQCSFLAPFSIPLNSFSQENKSLQKKKSYVIQAMFQPNTYGHVVWVKLEGKEHISKEIYQYSTIIIQELVEQQE